MPHHGIGALNRNELELQKMNTAYVWELTFVPAIP